MIQTFSIDDLISDAKLALNSGAYFSALALTLAIISACAKAKYPDEWFEKYADKDKYLQEHFPTYFKNGKYSQKQHDKERFQMWIDDWENGHNCDGMAEQQMEDYARCAEEDRKCMDDKGNLTDKKMPIENGELIYQLRCAILHSASSEIEFQDPKKISDEGNSKVLPQNFTLTLDKNNQFDFYPRGGSSVSSYNGSSIDINVNGFVCHYLKLAELYAKNNKDKFSSAIRIQDNRNS